MHGGQRRLLLLRLQRLVWADVGDENDGTGRPEQVQLRMADGKRRGRLKTGCHNDGVLGQGRAEPASTMAVGHDAWTAVDAAAVGANADVGAAAGIGGVLGAALCVEGVMRRK